MESTAGPGPADGDDRTRVEPMDPARARGVFWVVLLLLGGMQAWAARHTTTPDGMSYVDLSDAVVNGNLGELLNAYWSPLYPALLGVLRLVLRPGPYWEYAVQHFLNVLLFAASIAAFEYFLNALNDAAVQWGRRELTMTSGRVAGYAIFGVFSLMMTPLTLPTPDLLVSTATFLVFGAMLRLMHDAAPRRTAIVLGLALALGSLAKSFIVPWSVICLGAAFLATRSRWGWRPGATSAAIWLAAILPWSIALSAKVGYPTFGDTGRLTYVWYVNQVESPSDKMMPHAAATPATDSILKGIAITPDSPGTNPVWYDPARYYADLHPRFEPKKQLKILSFFVGQYVSSLAPVVLFLWFTLAVARRDERRLWWGRTWVVMAPCLAAIGAYSLVLVTTRYVAPFYVAMILVMWLGMEWPSRITPGRMLLAIGVPFLIMVGARGTTDVVSFEGAAIGSVLFAWAGRRWGTTGMVVCGVLGAVLLKILLPASLRSIVIMGAVLIVACYWIASRRAIANHEGRQFSLVVRRGVMITSGLLIGLVAFLKYRTSIEPTSTGEAEPNANWIAATALRQAGIAVGERIAIVGSPFEAYWARTGQLHIVAVVPPPRMRAYLALPPEKRDALFREFARAGATQVVVQTTFSPAPTDSAWIPVRLVGWTKRLAAKQ